MTGKPGETTPQPNATPPAPDPVTPAEHQVQDETGGIGDGKTPG